MIFNLQYTDKNTKARAGEIVTDHGHFPTPAFMPIGTAGMVKAAHLREIRDDIGAGIILGNTYHLYLRPGTAVIEAAGGLHRFNGWDRSLLTDSGGYQVFSLASRRQVKEEGILFHSHIDGSLHTFTPENVIDIQRAIGGDIIMVLDECTPYPCGYDYASQSMQRTHRWLQRCMSRFAATSPKYGYKQDLFPIVQGSTYRDLRSLSAETIAAADAPGNAIGGLSVGEPAEEMYGITELVCSILPETKPRYLMGVGSPANILETIALGIDLFDCVMPTRNGRNGWLFTKNGIINIRNEKWKNDFSPVDEDGYSFVDQDYSRALLRHLFVAGEMLGPMIATLHNLAFYVWLMREARARIVDGTFDEWKTAMTGPLQDRI
jgi:queuine tRNA-ribosyltransferase